MLAKAPTGIRGFDEITHGGIPRGRTTLVAGNAGSGKTTLAMHFLTNGAQRLEEPGVFVSFEESPRELAENFAPFGIDLQAATEENSIAVEYLQLAPMGQVEAGSYSLEGLFLRLEAAIRAVDAKRVVLDTLESLFTRFDDQHVVRSELNRLFDWLKEQGVTTIVTAEAGAETLTRKGLEEYISDCVVFIDHRIDRQVGTRRLRVVKYRGSAHGTAEYPFLIGEQGVELIPITSFRLDYDVSKERISSGVADLDGMLGGEGYFVGSSILLTGTAGTGKSSLAGAFAQRVCESGGRALVFAYEESESQIVRNMESIGVHVARWLEDGSLTIVAERPALSGLEEKLHMMTTELERHQPTAVVIDPISGMSLIGRPLEVRHMLTRFADSLKQRNITTLLTSLKGEEAVDLEKEVGISSVVDTWIDLKTQDSSGRLRNELRIVKSRGMEHSRHVAQLVISHTGLSIAGFASRETASQPAEASR